MNRWGRYGLPLIPAMAVGLVAMRLVGFSEPQTTGGHSDAVVVWLVGFVGLLVVAYIVGVVVLRRRH